MSFISIIMTLLPIILKIIAMISGGGAALSASRLSGMPDASYGDYGTYVGGWGGAALASWGLGELAAWWKRSTASSSIDWSKVVAGVNAGGGVNVWTGIKLLGRIFYLVNQDPEASKLFAETFGVKASSMPHDANALAHLALVRRD